MYDSAFRLSLAFFCGLTISAPAQTASSGAIAGIVVDAGSNSPIRRSVITLSTVEAQPQDAVAWTDSNGRFSFGYLPPGRYLLRAMKNGYQGASYGADFSSPGGDYPTRGRPNSERLHFPFTVDEFHHRCCAG